MPDESCYLLLKHIREFAPETAVIMVSGIQEIAMVVKCMHAGAFDYSVKPLAAMNRLQIRLAHAVEQKKLRKHNKILKASHRIFSMQKKNQLKNISISWYINNNIYA